MGGLTCRLQEETTMDGLVRGLEIKREAWVKWAWELAHIRLSKGGVENKPEGGEKNKGRFVKDKRSI